MKLTSWNIRGLNGPMKYRMIKNMMQQERPHVFFIQETKCNNNTLGSILSRAWPGSHSVAVDASGASGGLAIAWDPQAISITDAHVVHNIIQATFHLTGTNIHGHLTNVYFSQDSMQKIALLNTMEALSSNRTHPLWIMGGDFNMIRKSEEKRGGWAKLDMESTHFKTYIQNNLLIDLPFSNDMHTWNNKCSGSQQIVSKLDCFLISDNAIHIGGDIQASILPLSNGCDLETPPKDPSNSKC